MIKFIGTILFIILLAIGGYAVYRGLTSDNDNADKVASKASELFSSVADTFSDGAKDIANDAKSLGAKATDPVKAAVLRAGDSAKSGVASRIGDIREANKKKFNETKNAAKDKIDSLKK